MTLAYVGNFEPPHSTENDILKTLRSNGADVVPHQEQKTERWEQLLDDINSSSAPSVIMWTRTASLSAQVPSTLRWRMLAEAALREIPTVGVHLDRWWGLSRQPDIYGDPFFRVFHLFTADGAHQKQWRALGINHSWMPPAIAPHNTSVGEVRREFRSDVAFVGSWRNYGHREWGHRRELADFLRHTYRGRVKFWPEPDKPAIRGKDLADLYASAKVVVGDSCLAPTVDGEPMRDYCSDRVFETIGRFGMLVHPAVQGVTDGWLVTSGEHLMTWPLGDWRALKSTVDALIQDDDRRTEIRRAGHKHVAALHTYRNRLEDILRVSSSDWSSL